MQAQELIRESAEGPGDYEMTVRDVAKALNKHPRTIRNWIKWGIAPDYIEVGPRDRRFSRSAVERRLRRGMTRG